MYSEHDWHAFLDRQAVKSGAKKTYNTHKVLATSAAWRENAYGSAECASGSWNKIVDAYNDYRMAECWV